MCRILTSTIVFLLRYHHIYVPCSDGHVFRCSFQQAIFFFCNKWEPDREEEIKANTKLLLLPVLFDFVSELILGLPFQNGKKVHNLSFYFAVQVVKFSADNQKSFVDVQFKGMLPWEGIFIVYMTWQWHGTKKDNFYPASRNLQYPKSKHIPISKTIKLQLKKIVPPIWPKTKLLWKSLSGWMDISPKYLEKC